MLDEGVYKPFTKSMKITRAIKVEDDSETSIKLKIVYIDFFGGKRSVIVTPSTLSNKVSLIKLSDKGMDINDKNVGTIQRYLSYSLNDKDSYKIINNHTKLGFYKIKGELCFKHCNIISINEGNEESKYSGHLDLRPTGTYEEYCEFLKTEVIGYPSLQLVCALSLTAPILWLISEFNTEIESMVINLAGKSSSGKSTALMLAMSLWGNCQVTSNNKSLIKNWNATSNSLLKDISQEGFQGIPISLDELGMSNIKDFSNFIYTISSGMDKKRLTSESKLMEIEIFKTVVLSSGELTLRDNIKSKTVGSNLIRLIEFHDVQWTNSAQQSNKIKSFVSHNYGTFAPEFIKLLLENIDLIVDNWIITVDEIKDLVIEKVGSYGERLAMKFALILVAYSTMMDQIGLENEKDQNSILELLLDTLEGQGEESDLSRKAYDCIMNEFVVNGKSYLKYTNSKYKNILNSNETYPTRVYGKYCGSEYVITRDRFETVLHKNGFKDIRLIVKEWMDKDIIIPEKVSNQRSNPFNRRVITNDIKVAVIVIRKNNIYEDDDDSMDNDECSKVMTDRETEEFLFEDEY